MTIAATGHLFRRSGARPLPQVVRAEGVWIETKDGRRYLDGSAGALVASIGHGVREVVEAQARQAGAAAAVPAAAARDAAQPGGVLLPLPLRAGAGLLRDALRGGAGGRDQPHGAAVRGGLHRRAGGGRGGRGAGAAAGVLPPDPTDLR